MEKYLQIAKNIFRLKKVGQVPLDVEKLLFLRKIKFDLPIRKG